VKKGDSKYCVKLEATSRRKQPFEDISVVSFDNSRNSEEDDPAPPFVGVVH
jgi:hypothetical protein